MAEVIVALDVRGREAALSLVDRLGERASFFKVGFELFVHEGPEIAKELKGRGKRVFLDLKLHDIPNTAAAAVRAARELEVELLTVHASGGGAMMRAASEAAGTGGPRLLAVTVLTSLGDADLAGAWGRSAVRVEEEVVRLARLALDAGVRGVVASPKEAAALRRRMGPELFLVTPGVRPAGSAGDDQARTATPAEAVLAGADALVIGRAITRAPDPEGQLLRILDEVEAATEREMEAR